MYFFIKILLNIKNIKYIYIYKNKIKYIYIFDYILLLLFIPLRIYIN